MRTAAASGLLALPEEVLCQLLLGGRMPKQASGRVARTCKELHRILRLPLLKVLRYEHSMMTLALLTSNTVLSAKCQMVRALRSVLLVPTIVHSGNDLRIGVVNALTSVRDDHERHEHARAWQVKLCKQAMLEAGQGHWLTQKDLQFTHAVYVRIKEQRKRRFEAEELWTKYFSKERDLATWRCDQAWVQSIHSKRGTDPYLDALEKHAREER